MDSDPDADDLMAQTMGFSSFGGQSRPQKKRRYNPRADAAQGPAPPSPAVTGANNTALGVPRTTVNVDEMGLDDEDEEEPQNGSGAAISDDQSSGGAVPSAMMCQTQARPASLPQRPAPATTGTPASEQARHVPHGKQTDGPWYEGYYDPMSNENPWGRLEKAKGLESKGSWLPRAVGPPPGRP